MAQRKMLSVWVDPGDIVHFVSEHFYKGGERESVRRVVLPYTIERTGKLRGLIQHLQQTGWILRPFYAAAVGWVAEKGD